MSYSVWPAWQAFLLPLPLLTPVTQAIFRTTFYPDYNIPPTYDMAQTIYEKCHLTSTCVHCPCFGCLTVSFNSSFSAKSTQSCSDQKFLPIEHMENLIMDLMLINPYHMVQRMCQL